MEVNISSTGLTVAKCRYSKASFTFAVMFRCSRSTVTSLKTTYRYSSSTSGPAPGKRFISGRSIVLTIALGTPAALYFFYPDASRSAPTSSDAPLSPSHFTPATVESTVGSGPNTKLMTLVIPPNLIPQSALGPIWSVFIKDDQIQVERPYTPLYGIDESGRMEFWIKKYPKGEVGRWLHSKAVGDTIELRGPLSTWHWKEDAWDEVIMVNLSRSSCLSVHSSHSLTRSQEGQGSRLITSSSIR